MQPAIRTEQLAKTYRVGFFRRRVVGLETLDLQVEQGEIFGFIGPNGAGKTTTIKILTGLHRATGGQAWLMGEPCATVAARARLGFLPERPYFYEHLSARELLFFMGRLSGVEPAVLEQRVHALIARVQLERFADLQLKRFSKGMLQRVGLCQALLNDPALLILDEPMSGLDPLGRALVRDIILEERAAGRTVFFSTHILHDVETLSDRVAILVGGELRGLGTVSQLLSGRLRLVEITFQGQVDLPDDIEQKSLAEGTCLSLQEADVGAMIDRLRGAGARVVSVQPVRETLEQVLLDEVERARPVDRRSLEVLA